MAFALALQSIHDLPDGHGQIILTATTAIVVLTVGFLMLVIKYFNLIISHYVKNKCMWKQSKVLCYFTLLNLIFTLYSVSDIPYLYSYLKGYLKKRKLYVKHGMSFLSFF